MLSKILCYIGICSLIVQIVTVIQFSFASPHIPISAIEAKDIIMLPITAIVFLGSIAAKLQDW